jgi:hypothetical protein
LIANRPRSAAVKCAYGPKIRASFDKSYGLVHNTEQRAAASVSLCHTPAEEYHGWPEIERLMKFTDQLGVQLNAAEVDVVRPNQVELLGVRDVAP